jgi:hypothetical protein
MILLAHTDLMLANRGMSTLPSWPASIEIATGASFAIFAPSQTWTNPPMRTLVHQA